MTAAVDGKWLAEACCGVTSPHKAGNATIAEAELWIAGDKSIAT